MDPAQLVWVSFKVTSQAWQLLGYDLELNLNRFSCFSLACARRILKLNKANENLEVQASESEPVLSL